MTFNIRFDTPDDGVNAWPNRREMANGVVREQAPDVVGIQEAMPNQLTDMAVPLKYAHVGVPRADGREGGGELSAILFREERLEAKESGTFWLSPTPETPGSTGWGNHVPRICTWAHFVDREARRPFWVFNTHLDHESQPARAHGIELIVQRMRERSGSEPVFLMGDLNADETNAVVLYLKGLAARASEGTTPVPASPRFVDTYRTRFPNEKQSGTFNFWRGETGGMKIDFIFAAAPPATEVLDAAILHTSREGRFPSDHYPVVAHVRVR